MRCHAPILGLALGLAAPAAAQEACLRDTPWGPQIAPYEQQMTFELIARDETAAIVGIRFSPLQGEFAKLYGFFLYSGDCVTEAMIVGAFASANEFRNVETLGPEDQVRYHEDFYSSTTHATLDVSQSPRDYEAAKALALGLFRN